MKKVIKKKKTAKKVVAKKKKVVAKKRKKVAVRTVVTKKVTIEKPIGVVTHFYNAIKVAIVKFKKPVKAGAKLRVRGATTDFTFTASSMQFDHKSVSVAPKGKQIGIKVPKRVRESDAVYLV
jgi:hypothetical protein